MIATALSWLILVVALAGMAITADGLAAFTIRTWRTWRTWRQDRRRGGL